MLERGGEGKQSRITAYSRNCLTPRVEDFTMIIQRNFRIAVYQTLAWDSYSSPSQKEMSVVSASPFQLTDWLNQKVPSRPGRELCINQRPLVCIGGINWTTDSLGGIWKNDMHRHLLKNGLWQQYCSVFSNWFHIPPRYTAKPHFPVLL